MKLYCIRRTERLEVWCDDGCRIQCIGQIVVDNPGSPLAVPSLLEQMEQMIRDISYQYLEESADDPLPMDREDAETAAERLSAIHRDLNDASRRLEDALAAVEEIMTMMPRRLEEDE